MTTRPFQTVDGSGQESVIEQTNTMPSHTVTQTALAFFASAGQNLSFQTPSFYQVNSSTTFSSDAPRESMVRCPSPIPYQYNTLADSTLRGLRQRSRSFSAISTHNASGSSAPDYASSVIMTRRPSDFGITIPSARSKGQSNGTGDWPESYELNDRPAHGVVDLPIDTPMETDATSPVTASATAQDFSRRTNTERDTPTPSVDIDIEGQPVSTRLSPRYCQPLLTPSSSIPNSAFTFPLSSPPPFSSKSSRNNSLIDPAVHVRDTHSLHVSTLSTSSTNFPPYQNYHKQQQTQQVLSPLQPSQPLTRRRRRPLSLSPGPQPNRRLRIQPPSAAGSNTPSIGSSDDSTTNSSAGIWLAREPSDQLNESPTDLSFSSVSPAPTRSPLPVREIAVPRVRRPSAASIGLAAITTAVSGASPRSRPPSTLSNCEPSIFSPPRPASAEPTTRQRALIATGWIRHAGEAMGGGAISFGSLGNAIGKSESRLSREGELIGAGIEDTTLPPLSNIYHRRLSESESTNISGSVAGRARPRFLSRVQSMLDSEAHTLELEVQREREIQEQLREQEHIPDASDLGIVVGLEEVKDIPRRSASMNDMTNHTPATNPVYVRSRLNPEWDFFRGGEPSPSPTSSCVSSPGLNPIGPGSQNSASLSSLWPASGSAIAAVGSSGTGPRRAKRKASEGRLEPHSSALYKRRAASPCGHAGGYSPRSILAAGSPSPAWSPRTSGSGTMLGLSANGSGGMSPGVAGVSLHSRHNSWINIQDAGASLGRLTLGDTPGDTSNSTHTRPSSIANQQQLPPSSPLPPSSSRNDEGFKNDSDLISRDEGGI